MTYQKSTQENISSSKFVLKVAGIISLFVCALTTLLVLIIPVSVGENLPMADTVKSSALLITGMLFTVFMTISMSLYLSLHFFVKRYTRRIQSTAVACIDEVHDIVNQKQFARRLSISGNPLRDVIAETVNTLLGVVEAEIAARLKLARMHLDDQMVKSRLDQDDKLTGLPNRLYFTQKLQNELSKAKVADENPALILLDLLGFKTINDVYGIAKGDELLVAFSERLRKFASDVGLVARLSSDEFLIFVTKPMNEVTLLEYASNLVDMLHAPYQIDDWSLKVEVTCGISYAQDSDYTLTDILANVDIAQQYAKFSASENFSLYVPAMKADKLREQLIASSIQSGLKNNEFLVYYQAKVNSNSDIVGYEALIRWQSSELGFLSPAEFIPIAEKSGKIRYITTWLIDQVFSDIHGFVKAQGPDIRVSMNLSAIDLKNNTLLSTIDKCMLIHKVDGKNVEFEITESSYLENLDRVKVVFEKLNEKGCQLALDDFGTGYSSLSYLTRIKANVLKLDKQFVDELGASASGKVVTECIVNMAHQLNMAVCAEGVESKAQAEMLLNIGCEQLQGFYFSKPAPFSTHFPDINLP